ncbi:MAG: flagellar basal body rod protein FlgC [Proteobacteria bacterium]|nr:flagellar basal body rod protein FlgC [Pseudomonadota bacterium]
MNILDTLRVSSSGMVSQRIRLQAIASNIANAESTRTAEGTPYRRKMPVFSAISVDDFGSSLEQALKRVEVVDIEESQEEFPVVYNPGHPDADADGYVELPNVKILHEMVDMMTATRTYEANTAAVETTYQLATLALELSR